jgi:GTP-binding protein
VQDKLEKLSVADALRAVDFAEVVVLLLDATRGLEVQDLKIADNAPPGRPRARHRAQQMGRRRECLQPVQRRQGALDEGLAQVKGVPLLTVSARPARGSTC